MIADRHEDVAGTRADGFGAQLALEFEIELIHLHVRDAAIAAAPLGNGEHDVKQDRENAARHRRDRLREEVDDGDEKQNQRDDAETDRYLHAANAQVERHLELALAGIRVAQHENGEAVHREAPDHAECIQVGEERDIAAADDDRGDLQDDDDVDDAIAGAEFRVRLAEPLAEHAVFGNAIEHAVGPDDCSVDRAGENQRSDDNDETVEDQAGDERPSEDGSGLIRDELAEERLAEVTETGEALEDEGAESLEPGREDTSEVLAEHHPHAGNDAVLEGNTDESKDEAVDREKVEEGGA